MVVVRKVAWKATLTLWAIVALRPGSTMAQVKDAACKVVHASIERVSSQNVSRPENALESKPRIDGGGQADSHVSLSLIGPILGAMDSSQVESEVGCTDDGFQVTITITRSADYRGAVLANVNWRPIVNVTAELKGAQARVVAVWRMRRTDGVAVRDGYTPPRYPQTYPAMVVRVVQKGVQR